MRFKPAVWSICFVASALATAQTNDEQNAASLESERERLGNQRILQDIELRKREEQRRLEEAEQQRLKVQQEAERERQRVREEALANNAPSAPVPQSSPSGTSGNADMSRTLQQLRTLGELKDAGYITVEEFERIKEKILDDQI